MDKAKRKKLEELGMREQCASCACDKQFHRDDRCGVCNEWCPYQPAWIER